MCKDKSMLITVLFEGEHGKANPESANFLNVSFCILKRPSQNIIIYFG